MGEGNKGMIHGFSLPVMEDDDEFCESSSSSFDGDSDTELGDDETSSSQSSSSQLDSSFDLSLLMAELPIKRGLSKYFEGKSQSFRSLSDVRSLEDLAKEENPIRKRIKACRGSADATQRPCNTPRIHGRTISKKGSSCASSLTRRNRSGSLLFSSSKLPALPLNKNLRSSGKSTVQNARDGPLLLPRSIYF